ncbi:hypothetical protein IAU60_004358 [Kwoniella sp. DSM 27419]
MLSHATFSYLLPLTTRYAEDLPNVSSECSSSLARTLDALLKLLKTTTPPAPAAGPSSRAPTPPTVITQALVTSHLIPIFLSTLVLAYTPSVPPEEHASLRAAFMQALLSMSPGHAISTLVNVLKLLVQGRKEGAKVHGWVRDWPKYPEGIINGLLTAQVRRPGGVRGLMENVLGETAKTDDGKRLDHIFNVLVRIPRQVIPEIYYPWLLSELFSMIPLADTSHHHPVAFVNTACYSIQRLWASNRPLIGDWLRNKLHSPWHPKVAPATDSEPTVVPTEAIQRSVQNMRLLLLHNPSSPEFADFVVGPILAPLFSLYSFLAKRQQQELAVIQQRNTAPASGRKLLLEDIGVVLQIWGKEVDPAQGVQGVQGIWSIIKGREGWGDADEDGLSHRWEVCGEGVRLVTESLDALSRLKVAHLADPPETPHAPDAGLLCHLVKSLDRPDIACEIILKLLDMWRIRTATEKEPSTDSLHDLQLTIQMMEQLGPQLFSKPQQVLGFVERVLRDQAEAAVTDSEEDEERSAIEELSDGREDDAAPDGKRGLIEVACQLLASLDGQLDSGDLTIVHPITAHLEALSTHSPSVSIRNAAREARLLLLSHQDEPYSNSPDYQASYDQALGFLSDPILPVRAHGADLLVTLATSPDVPAEMIQDILHALLTALYDDDSFVYLSVIKALSTLVDKLGLEVLQLLMNEYTGLQLVLENDKLLDMALRVAEALGQVIERAGEVLSGYALLRTFPSGQLPTVLRSSALSLLSTAARASPFAILPWAVELVDAILDLLQTGSVASSPFRPILGTTATPAPPLPQWGRSKLVRLVDDEPEPEPEPGPEPSTALLPPRIIDSEPVKAHDGKHPALRRAALVALDWVIRALLFTQVGEDQETEFKMRMPTSSSIATKEAESGHDVAGLPKATLDRAETVLGYMMKTDNDEVVRQHAASAGADLQLLRTGGLDLGGIQLPAGLERSVQALRIS